MKYNRHSLSAAFWHALEHVIEHFYADELNDYRRWRPHERSLNHIYHSLRTLRQEVRRPCTPLDITAALASRGQVAIVWSTEDVLGVRPHLTRDQAWDVLGRCERIHDCNYGFTWDLLEAVADDMYPASAAKDKEDAK